MPRSNLASQLLTVHGKLLLSYWTAMHEKASSEILEQTGSYCTKSVCKTRNHQGESQLTLNPGTKVYRGFKRV